MTGILGALFDSSVGSAFGQSNNANGPLGYAAGMQNIQQFNTFSRPLSTKARIASLWEQVEQHGARAAALELQAIALTALDKALTAEYGPEAD